MESVCIFGSAARGNTDALSDRDVLIVTDSWERRRALRSEWAQKGWSVASYSPSRLRSISDQGGLFVQHLKREGVIVSDPQGWLSRLLQRYRAKESYQADLRQSLQLLQPLDRRFDGYWECLFAADVLYVFVRNAGIYELASRHVYEFSYERIIRHLSFQKGISKEEADALLSLRMIKSAYREREKLVDARDDLNVAIGAVRSMFEVDIAPTLPCHCWARFSSNSYSVLRDLEARLVATFDIHELDGFAMGKRIGAYWRMITDPRAYSWRMRGIDLKELRRVNHLVDVLVGSRWYGVPQGQEPEKTAGAAAPLATHTVGGEVCRSPS